MFSLAKWLIVGNNADQIRDYLTSIIALITLVATRLVPHPPNMTPLMPVALSLAARFGSLRGLIISAAALLGSDLGLASVYHGVTWGSWSWFCYSGLLLPMLAAQWLPGRWHYFVSASIGCGFGFWLWTNFGVWLQSPTTYAHNLSGLLQCYKIALPFLANQLVGDAMWALAWYGLMKLGHGQARQLTKLMEIEFS
jgi:hypothetical protein